MAGIDHGHAPNGIRPQVYEVSSQIFGARKVSDRKDNGPKGRYGHKCL